MAKTDTNACRLLLQKLFATLGMLLEGDALDSCVLMYLSSRKYSEKRCDAAATPSRLTQHATAIGAGSPGLNIDLYIVCVCAYKYKHTCIHVLCLSYRTCVER